MLLRCFPLGEVSCSVNGPPARWFRIPSDGRDPQRRGRTAPRTPGCGRTRDRAGQQAGDKPRPGGIISFRLPFPRAYSAGGWRSLSPRRGSLLFEELDVALTSAMLLGSMRSVKSPRDRVISRRSSSHFSHPARSALGGSARCSQSPMAAWEWGDDAGQRRRSKRVPKIIGRPAELLRRLQSGRVRPSLDVRGGLGLPDFLRSS